MHACTTKNKIKMRKFILSYCPQELFPKDTRNKCLTLPFIALIMLLLEYYGWQGPFINLISKKMGMVTLSKNELFFKSQIYTSSAFFLLLFILPFFFNLIFPFNSSEKSIGLHFLNYSQWKKALLTYGPLVIFMLPILWIACGRESFYQFYPLYKPNSLKVFFLYELIYLTQFISIEFFFRGFGLFRLEKITPGYGIYIMVIPYSLIHIHKPFGEALGSIFAGLVLGHLALKTKSIWPGVLIHSCIAFSADLFSLIHSGRFQNF
jgi:uncharacterized protein